MHSIQTKYYQKGIEIVHSFFRFAEQPSKIRLVICANKIKKSFQDVA